MKNAKDESQKPIIFFDGYCGLCNRFVDFLFKRDKKDRLRFASLQGETAAQLFPNGELERFDSIGFWQDGKLYYKSTGVLRILKVMGRGWQLLLVGYILPPFVRDALYDFVARNRYKWFGKRETCRIPDVKERFKILP